MLKPKFSQRRDAPVDLQSLNLCSKYFQPRKQEHASGVCAKSGFPEMRARTMSGCKRRTAPAERGHPKCQMSARLSARRKDAVARAQFCGETKRAQQQTAAAAAAFCCEPLPFTVKPAGPLFSFGYKFIISF